MIALLILALISLGQNKLPYVGPNQIFLFPNGTNKFIEAESINWALDAEESISFANSTRIKNENVFSHLISKVVTGELKAYDLRIPSREFEALENYTFSEVDRFPQKALIKQEIDFMLSDSAKEIMLHEIFYLNNYSLNCQIISAAPLMRFFTSSGIDLGKHGLFFCCTNINGRLQVKKDTSLVHLKKIERVLNFDSIRGSRVIKQTYGLNLSQSIWSGASKGLIKLVDLQTNQFIAAGNVMNYPYFDSSDASNIDNKNGTNAGYNAHTQAVFPYKLANTIQFTQDLFYDPNRNIFICTMSDCFLYVYNFNWKTFALDVEKRFRVIN